VQPSFACHDGEIRAGVEEGTGAEIEAATKDAPIWAKKRRGKRSLYEKKGRFLRGGRRKKEAKIRRKGKEVPSGSRKKKRKRGHFSHAKKKKGNFQGQGPPKEGKDCHSGVP